MYTWNDMLASEKRIFPSFPLFQVFIHLVIVVLALVMGRIAVTGNIIHIALAVSLLFGVFLIVKPKVLIALTLILGLLVTGILPLWFPSLTRLTWAVSLLGFVLWGIAFVTHVLQNKRDKNPTPLFMTIAVIFFLYCIVVSIAQWESAAQLLTAVKRYFQVWGVMFALAWLVIKPEEIRLMRKFMLFVALVQLPFALYELIHFVPFREAFVASMPGLVPIDVVVGTFEAELLGGGANAEMATFQIIIFAFLLSRWREKILATQRFFIFSSIVLIPLFIGETKIVVILLPLMFLGLYGGDLFKNPVKAMLAIFIGLFISILAGYVYVEFVIGQSLTYVIDDTLRYNIYNIGYGNNLLNRTTVLSFWWEKNSNDLVHILTGHGLGSAHSGGVSASGNIAKNYVGYGIGLTAISKLLWEVGLIGFVLFVMIIVFAWLQCTAIMKKAIEPSFQADLAAIRAVLPIFIVFLFYRSAVIEIMCFQLIFFLLLGYLALLSKLVNTQVLSTISGINK